MKLKKIVSLALAGVLAVSMLAGCKSTGAANGGASSEAPVATGLVEKTIAALSKDVTAKVTFSADSSLQTLMDVLAVNSRYGELTKDNVVGSLAGMNVGIASSQSQLPVIVANTAVADGCNDAKEQTYVFAVETDGVDEEYVAAQLAKKIQDIDVYDTTGGGNGPDITLAGLPTKGNVDDEDKMHFDFTYTASLAIVSDTDVTTASSVGQTKNVAVVILTRTGTKVDHSKV